MSTDAAKPKQFSRVIVIVGVVVTGAATLWAATKAGPLGPYTSWNRAQQATQQIWPGPAQAVPPQTPQPLPALPSATLGASSTLDNSAARTVGLPGVPAIIWSDSRPHRDRGPCVNCHAVAERNGERMPTITSGSGMPHEFRGVCNNCHQITVASFLGSLVGATRQVAPDAQPQMPSAMPNEVEWQGIEARPSIQGVVVTNADGAAARAGVQPGDIVESINGVGVGSTGDFVQVTQNGDLAQGTMIARRNNQRLAFQLQRNQSPPQQQSMPFQPQASTAFPQQQAMPFQQQVPEQPSLQR